MNIEAPSSVSHNGYYWDIAVAFVDGLSSNNALISKARPGGDSFSQFMGVDLSFDRWLETPISLAQA